MAIYYTIKANGFDPNKKLQNKIEVCLEIRGHQLKDYSVYEKDDSSMMATKSDTALIFPLAPMCNDITSEIKAILARYKKLDK